MTQSNIEIDITIQDKRWSTAIENVESCVKKTVLHTLHDRLLNTGFAEISVVLSDDPFIQTFNKNYREKDTPTNVLSFPMTEPEELSNPEVPFCALGDIILAYDTISREASEQNKTLPDHFTHMLIHGCLHLIHYDHQTEKEAESMENLEIDLLRKLGIKNPYESE